MHSEGVVWRDAKAILNRVTIEWSELQLRIGHRALLAIFAMLFLCNCGSLAEETWFNQRLTWNYGKEGLAWRTTIKNPSGPGQYELVLRPLWAVEGGVIALEIVTARSAKILTSSRCGLL